MQLSVRRQVQYTVLLLPLLAGVLLTGCSSGDRGTAPATAAGPASSATGTTPPAGPPSAEAPANPPRQSRSGTAGPAPLPVDTAPPEVAIKTLPPVAVGAQASIAQNLLVTVSRLRTLTVTARGPGETAGSAVAFTVEVRNRTSRPVDVGGFAVTASYGNATPAIPTGAAPADALSGRLAAGRTAAGTYVFRMPADQIGSLSIQVSSNSTPNIVVFRR